jgi:hypothetical protein
MRIRVARERGDAKDEHRAGQEMRTISELLVWQTPIKK